jgi:hypothetical protein
LGCGCISRVTLGAVARYSIHPSSFCLHPLSGGTLEKLNMTLEPKASNTVQLQTSHLRLENVTKRFGSVVAVERVTLEIPL